MKKRYKMTKLFGFEAGENEIIELEEIVVDEAETLENLIDKQVGYNDPCKKGLASAIRHHYKGYIKKEAALMIVKQWRERGVDVVIDELKSLKEE